MSTCCFRHRIVGAQPVAAVPMRLRTTIVSLKPAATQAVGKPPEWPAQPKATAPGWRAGCAGRSAHREDRLRDRPVETGAGGYRPAQSRVSRLGNHAPLVEGGLPPNIFAIVQLCTAGPASTLIRCHPTSLDAANMRDFGGLPVV